MTREEFNERVQKDVPQHEYKIIEYVYQFHPLISETEGKEQVTTLYKTFGVVIFKEMLPKAKEAEELEDKIRQTRFELNRLQERLEALKQ